MRKGLTIAAGGLLLAIGGCDDGAAPANKAADETPATPVAGEYEISSEVTALQSIDHSTPATKAKLGDKTTTKGCIAADGTPDMAMFVDPGDKCITTGSFASSGRISMQYQCSRPGKGNLYPNADGDYTKDGFEALVNVATQFSGPGDYQLTRHLKAKRIGNCPAGGEAAAKKA